ncbi:MAG: protease complex subunit PrcB family protein [Mesonia hippocampi]|uniref:protease complex subunit PrcB family protein n=2 Tax=Mesonia hippocampi TaxID=1628250 RepID=UPI003F9A762B
MKKILIIACLSVGLMACSSDDANEFEPTTITIESVIAKGEMGGPFFENELFTVITNQTDWQNLINQMSAIDPAAPETNVNFNHYEVIAVFDEVKTTGGYSIDIVNITEFKEKVEIKVDRLHKGNLTQIVTKPFHIVKISKLNKPAVFIAVN